MAHHLTIVGAGLAGSEAAWQAAEEGVKVLLFEMRPGVSTPAHKSQYFAELVCSNSLGSDLQGSAPHLLKQELRNLSSFILCSADKHSVPAGAALAVNRELYGRDITESLNSHPNITIKHSEIIEIPNNRPLIIATGPLTSESLAKKISSLLGQDYLYFYDSLSPIVDRDSIDYSKTFFASRYGKGSDDYLNCPMNVEEYSRFVSELLSAKKVEFKEFEKPFNEKPIYFEGCVPIEELARRGEKTLAFGPMKPVGLAHPKTGESFHAVLQLRKENIEGSAYNLVGCQTKLTYSEQKRIFRLIPGLEKVEFFRYGAIHRNTYINSPGLLNPNLSLKGQSDLYFAGQIVGVEGYVESCAMGLIAGLVAARKIRGESFTLPPRETAIGSLLSYVSAKQSGRFQPMNINFGLLSLDRIRIKNKKLRNKKIIDRALESQRCWLEKSMLSC